MVASGTPEALWNNASKKLTITNVLDTGNVELFGMTYHPDYPGTAGYVNWITYALDTESLYTLLYRFALDTTTIELCR